MDKLVPRREVLKVLNVHYQTLRNMVERGDIDTVSMGNKKLYNLDKYLRVNGVTNRGKIRRKICYCRVSSNKQRPDLKRQIEYMKLKYPHYEILSDIGSGLNYNRPKLNIIIDYAINGEIDELVVAYKDRLARFGYEIIERLITKYSNGKIIIINKTEEETPEEEITKDIITIMNVYTAKINGLRKYKKKIKDEIMKKK